MDPDPTLIIRGAPSMRRIDKLFKFISPVSHQIRVDVNTPLHQACDIDVQMQAGLRSPDAFQVYNPEVVRLKAEATHAISEGALVRILKSEIKVLQKIDKTRQKIRALEEKISALGKTSQRAPTKLQNQKTKFWWSSNKSSIPHGLKSQNRPLGQKDNCP